MVKIVRKTGRKVNFEKIDDIELIHKKEVGEVKERFFQLKKIINKLVKLNKNKELNKRIIIEKTSQLNKIKTINENLNKVNLNEFTNIELNNIITSQKKLINDLLNQIEYHLKKERILLKIIKN